LKADPEAIAGEMEAAGIASAADREKIEFIVIKGICDWGENKDKKNQELAARNAFSFAMEVVRLLS
jgi:nucleoside phosphorylase